MLPSLSLSASILSLSLLLPQAAAVDFGPVFSAKPSLKHAKPIKTTTVNRQVVASSVISHMNSIKAHSTAAKRTTKTTKKAQTTKKTSTKKPANKAAAKKKTTKHKKVDTKKHKTTAKKHSLKARDAAPACAPQQISYGYVPSPNTPAQFLLDNFLVGVSGKVLSPAGYTQNFSNAVGSVYGSSYLGYYQLASYNQSQCGAICDSVAGCQAYNIYFERDPVVVPSSGPGCSTNPNAATTVACALWGSPINGSQAQNVGSWRSDFMVLITGSNGYNKNPTPPTVNSFAAPVALPAAIDTSSMVGASSPLLNTSFFASSTFQPNQCASLCQSTTANNKAAAVQSGASSYQACNYFTAFLVNYNAATQGTYCQLFTTDVSKFATQYTQTVNGVTYSFTNSYGYTLSNPDSGLTGLSGSSSAATTTATTAASVTSAASSVITSAPVSMGVGKDGFTTTTFPPTCSSLATDIYALNDPKGNAWLYMCGGGTGGSAANVLAASPDWTGCFALCANSTGCTGFSYVNGPNLGAGPGQCWLKNVNPNSFASTTNLLSTRIGAILRASATYSSGAAAAATPTVSTVSTASAATTAAASPAAANTAASSNTVNTATSATNSAATASGTSDLCPSGNFTTVSDNNGVKYLLFCGFNANPGSDLGSVNAPNMGACLTACTNTAGCASVTLAGTGCYMRSSFAGKFLASGVASAVIYNPKNYARGPRSQGSSGCGTALPSNMVAGGNTVTVQFPFQGLARTYNIHIPTTYDPNIPAPLIFAFHGKGDQASTIEGSTGLSGEGFNPFGISIYPQGVNNVWQSDPSTIGTSPYVDDQSWVNAIISSVSSNFCVDTHRIWGSGFSNGGGLIGVLSCNSSLSTTFSAFTAHSAALYTSTSAANCTGNVPSTLLTNNIVESVCSPGNPSLPMLEFHGDADTTIAYTGGPRQNQCLPTIPHWVTDWAGRDGLGSTNTTSTPVNGTTLYQFGSGSSLGLVSHYKIAGWGHVWASRSAGAVIDATSIMMDFFYSKTG